MIMIEIEVFIEKSSDSYSAYAEDYNLTAHADTISECKKQIDEAIEINVDSLPYSFSIKYVYRLK